MTRITFIEANGTEHPVEAAPGKSVMQAAIDNLVNGIVAECGGSCSCCTCQAYIDEAFLDRIPKMADAEEGMLDGSPHRRANSRLTCQIPVTAELEGLVVRLPVSQY